MSASETFLPDWVSPPGETIADVLRRRAIAPSSFAASLGRTPDGVQALLDGEDRITPELAGKLEALLGPSASFWLTRDAQFLESRARLQGEFDPIARREWLRDIPIGDMIKFGWIKPSSGVAERAQACLQFFGVPNPRVWRETYSGVFDAVAFRATNTFETRPAAVAAWLRFGEVSGAAVECEPWNPDRLRAAIPELRYLSRSKSPHDFLEKLKAICARCGVAVVIAPAPSGCRASGATCFLSDSKALLLLSLRYRSDDHFWFTFFHEVGHLLLHSKGALFIEGAELESTHEEEEANAFAAETLLSPEHVRELPDLGSNFRAVMRFARRAGISPGIVVGQMQHRGLLRRNQLNFLKTRYNWSADGTIH